VHFISEHVEGHFNSNATSPSTNPCSGDDGNQAAQTQSISSRHVDPQLRSVNDVLRGQLNSVVSVRIRKRKREPGGGPNAKARSASPAIHHISEPELRANTPCELVHNALSEDEANGVLSLLLDESKFWQQSAWTVHGKTGTTNRISAVYDLQADQQADLEGESEGDLGLYKQRAPQVLESVSEHLAELLRRKISELKQNAAAGTISSERVTHIEDEGPWKATHVLCNLYRDRHDQVGAHSDRLTAIGPNAIILSLSLGASRVFRFGFGSPSGTEPVYSVALKHNDLLIMYPPMQEEWWHEVPPSSACSIHRLSGQARFNLTFRMNKPKYKSLIPKCHCGKGARLQASRQEGPNLGRFYYACENHAAPCEYFEWASWCRLQNGTWKSTL